MVDGHARSSRGVVRLTCGMAFRLGRPILVMSIVAVVSGALIARHRDPPRPDLVMWVFAEGHAVAYRSLLPQFERRTGRTVGIELMTGRAEDARLQSMFMSGQSGPSLPDVVEIEIGAVGKFFRPPVEDIALLPLNDRLERSGWGRRILPSRFAPWSKRGTIFGVPHDVHPVAIAYRRDLFEAAGIDLEATTLWPEFQAMGLRFQRYWQARGHAARRAIELPRSGPEVLTLMLLQRGVNIVDEHDTIRINDPIVARTVAFYVDLVAGPKRIASDSARASGMWTNDALGGILCAFVTPDWRIFQLQRFAPALEGRLHMMPLPRFEATDAPTATWGGTMIGITRHSGNHDLAWKLIEHLYLSAAGLEARQRLSRILPPVVEWWSRPEYDRADPFFGGQKVDRLYIELARSMPPRYVTPVTAVAEALLSGVLDRAVRHAERHDAPASPERIQAWLDVAAADLRRRLVHGRFEQ
jgi:arabinosaccharide transport system substrate-binding protein